MSYSSLRATLLATLAVSLSPVSLALAGFDITPRIVASKIETDGVDDSTGVSTSDLNVFAVAFGTNPGDPYNIGDPGFNTNGTSGFTSGTTLRVQPLTLTDGRYLQYWNGIGSPSFAAPPSVGGSPVAIQLIRSASNFTTLSENSLSYRPGSATSQLIGTFASNGAIHSHLFSNIGFTDASEDPVTNPVPTGAYLIAVRVLNRASNGITPTAIADSNVKYMLFTNGLSAAQQSAAVAGLTLWNPTTSANWSATNSWAGKTVPNAPGASATLGNTITTPVTATLTTPTTLGNLTIGSATPYTLAGTPTLTLDSGSPSPANVRVLTGSHNITAPVALATSATLSVASGAAVQFTAPITIPTGRTLTKQDPGQATLATVTGTGTLAITTGQATLTSLAGPAVTLAPSTSLLLTPSSTPSTTASLSLAPGSFLDITNNALIVRNGDVTTIRASIASWFANGARSGPGLGSSAATALTYTTLAAIPNTLPNSALPYFSTYGQTTLTPTDILIRHTYLGDTNLNGQLDPADLANILEGYSTGLTGWQNGDLNYDGTVNLTDLTTFLTAYNANLPTLQAGPLSTPPPTGAPIPEPALPALALTLLTPVLTRRRRYPQAHT